MLKGGVDVVFFFHDVTSTEVENLVYGRPTKRKKSCSKKKRIK
jgi:hypothetical protein